MQTIKSQNTIYPNPSQNWLKLPARFPKPICAADVGTTLTRFLTPTGDAEATEPTRVKIWRDREALYLEAKCQTAAMPRVRRSAEYNRDQQAADSLEIQIDVGRTQCTYLHAIILPSGNVTTYRGSSNRVEQGYHPPLTVKVVMRKKAWIVRLIIPFDGLGRPPREGEVWGLNILRVNRSEPTGYVQWSPTIEDATRPDLFGTLRFTAHPKVPVRDREVAAYYEWAQQRRSYSRKYIHRLEDFVAGDRAIATVPVRWEGIATGKRGIPARDRVLVLATANQLCKQIAGWTDKTPAGIAMNTMPWTALADAFLLTGNDRYAATLERAILVRDVVSVQAEKQLYNDFEVCRVALMAYAYLTVDKIRVMSSAVRAAVLRSVLRSARCETMRISDGYFYGNHQMYECAGLAILATLFPEFPERKEWARIASRGLAEHLRREVLDDGGYAERCGYHSVAMNFTTQAVVTIQLNHAEKLFPELMSRASLRRLEKMYEWVRAMRAPDDTLPTFGDFPMLPQLRILQQGAHALRNKALLQPPPAKSVTLPASRFTVMRSRQFYMAVDHGPLGGQHSHCDSMGFVAYAFGEPIAVEGGITDYNDSRYTSWFRKIQAHNVVVVDEAEPEKVAEQLAWRSTAQMDFLKMCGRGYEHSHGVVHERTIIFVKAGFWFIHDRLRARTGGHRYAWTLHSPVNLRIRQDGSLAGRSLSGRVGLLVLPGEPMQSKIECKPCATLKPGCSWVRASDMTRSNAELPMVTFHKQMAHAGDTTFATVLMPYRGKCPLAKLISVGADVYELQMGKHKPWRFDMIDVP